jgi:hypothetical protein
MIGAANPLEPSMSPSDPPLRRTITTEPAGAVEPEVIYTEVRDTGSTAAWWVGGLVAIVAIIAVVFLVSRNPNSDAQVANAVEQGRLQGALESSQSTLSQTQDAARQAAQSAASSATLAAGNTAVAADSAKRAAQSADAAATNASAVVADAPASAPANPQ